VRLRGLLALLALAAACAVEEPAELESVAGRTEALGEPTDGFPSWEERAVLVWTNRARADPATDLAACVSGSPRCAEAACYSPVGPLAWNHELARLARFHSDNLARAGCSLQHDSPCTLRTDVATLYTPGSCNGAPACACTDAASCGAARTIIWDRFARFGFSGGGRAENIATGSDPVTTFYRWLHENDTSSACGYRGTNGHRYSILNGSYRAIGIGKTTAGNIYTQDFHSTGSPTGIVAGVHYPRTGASLEFRANWASTAAPMQAQVNVDGTCTPMTLERGAGTNGTYLASLSGLSTACHRYFFQFRTASGDVFYPTTGSLTINCPTEYDATRPAVCGGCTPSCGARECGDDGCGGSCGACGAGETCNASGACVASCMPSCSGRACGDDGCGGSCGTCASGFTCNASGACVCPSGRTDCGGTCVNTSTNRNHCGGCGMACGPTETCTAGACVCTPSCTGRECGDDGCGGSCGACGAGRACGAGGTCVCTGGLTDCGGSCVDVRTDPTNCGACGTACGASEVCVASVCIAGGVDAGCAPACDGRECGDDTCGGSCGACGSGELCGAGGACVCSDSATDCGGACVDTRIDSSHCGACGAACAGGEVCVAGACEASGEPDAGVATEDGGASSGTDSGASARDGGTSAGGADDLVVRGACSCTAPGAPGPEPGPWGALACAGALLGAFARRRRAPAVGGLRGRRSSSGRRRAG
jgi:uncharacterized protein YkwD